MYRFADVRRIGGPEIAKVPGRKHQCPDEGTEHSSEGTEHSRSLHPIPDTCRVCRVEPVDPGRGRAGMRPTEFRCRGAPGVSRTRPQDSVPGARSRLSRILAADSRGIFTSVAPAVTCSAPTVGRAAPHCDEWSLPRDVNPIPVRTGLRNDERGRGPMRCEVEGEPRTSKASAALGGFT